MKRLLFLVFGVSCHLLFLVTFAWMACFVGNILVPWSIDAASTTAVGPAVLIDLLLLGLFCVPHSIMARPSFKRWWTRFVPEPIERSVYVLIACVSVIVLLVAWQPINITIWHIHSFAAQTALWVLFAAGWLLIPAASLMINHFDLFGTRQVWLHFRGRPYTALPFHTPMLYRWVRHPLYVGWLTAFWATPVMTAGHLLFAAALSAYILVAIGFEERDLVHVYGRLYQQYRQRVPMLIPGLGALVGPVSSEPSFHTIGKP